MGRKKSYDREVLIQKAMEIFRDHGFAGTSAEMLVNKLGINRYSLYAEFGSKQDLFEIALQRYDEESVERNFGPLEEPAAGKNEIRALLEFFGMAADGSVSGRGCLLCNTAVEFGPEDPSGSQYVQRYFERISSAFRNAIDNERRNGGLRQSVNPEEEAAFFTASVLGLFVMLRAKAPSTRIKRAVRVAIKHLDNLGAS